MSRFIAFIGIVALIAGPQFNASAFNPNAPYKYANCSGYLNQTDYFTVFSSVFVSKADEETIKKAMKSRVEGKYPKLKNITCYVTSTDTREYAVELLNSAKKWSKRKADLDFSF